LFPAPPGPPVAVAVFDKLFALVAVAVVSLPAVPGGHWSATPGVGFAAINPNGSAAVTNSRCNNS
jgi:hypothetical protein